MEMSDLKKYTTKVNEAMIDLGAQDMLTVLTVNVAAVLHATKKKDLSYEHVAEENKKYLLKILKMSKKKSEYSVEA